MRSKKKIKIKQHPDINKATAPDSISDLILKQCHEEHLEPLYDIIICWI